MNEVKNYYLDVCAVSHIIFVVAEIIPLVIPLLGTVVRKF